jgi:hypothetical protein
MTQVASLPPAHQMPRGGNRTIIGRSDDSLEALARVSAGLGLYYLNQPVLS